MQTIHAGNMKKSAFIRSQLEACKIGQKVKKIFLKKPFSTSIFEVLSNLYRAAPVAEWVRSLYFSALNHSIISPL